MNDDFNTYKTAIKRKSLSTPAKYLKDNALLVGDCLDFGCGQGFDCDALDIDGYDPHWRPTHPEKKYDTVMCNYVLNCYPAAFTETIVPQILEFLKEDGIAYIAVRNDSQNLKGWTKKETYQAMIKLDEACIVKKTSNFIMYGVGKDYK